jgi:hypothetical protein
MKRASTLFWSAVGATLIGLAAGSDAWARSWEKSEHWDWNGTISRKQTLEINGVNGDIVAEPGTGNRVIVTAEKHSDRQDPADVKIEVHQDSDGITICAVYPGQSSPCHHLDFSFREHSNDVSVDFHVTMPAGVTLKANNVNGGIHAHGFTGRVRARTVNGECAIETAGSGEASTVNGAVRADIGHLSPEDECSFRTVNGSITLSLPADVNAEVTSSTVNGNISSEFPLTIHSGWGPRSASGTLGRGGARLSAHTVNGAIRYERHSSM